MKNFGMQSINYRIRYSRHLDPKRIARIPKRNADQIERSMERKLLRQPEVFGKPLTKSLKGCWSLRVGDYRIVYRIVQKTVEILAIDHRSVVYELLERRLKKLGWDIHFPSNGSP